MESPNFVAVLVAALVPMVLGAIWYGPLFGKKWMQMIGKTEEELKANFNPAKVYGIMYLMNIITAYVMAHILGAYELAYMQTGWMAGVQGGFWAWLGFVLTIGYQSVAFEDKGLGLFTLNSLFNLVALIGIGIVLAIW